MLTQLILILLFLSPHPTWHDSYNLFTPLSLNLSLSVYQFPLGLYSTLSFRPMSSFTNISGPHVCVKGNGKVCHKSSPLEGVDPLIFRALIRVQYSTKLISESNFVSVLFPFLFTNFSFTPSFIIPSFLYTDLCRGNIRYIISIFFLYL